MDELGLYISTGDCLLSQYHALLTGGRFSLGLGCGIDVMFDAFRLSRIKTA
jgi:hypothetical protein